MRIDEKNFGFCWFDGDVEQDDEDEDEREEREDGEEVVTPYGPANTDAMFLALVSTIQLWICESTKLFDWNALYDDSVVAKKKR